MTKYEELLSAYEEEVEVEERKMKNEGLYCDGHIWINKDLPSSRKACILAEEIGHHMTSAGDITDQTDIGNRQQELKARKYAYNMAIPLQDINLAIDHGHLNPWDIAEYLGVDERFLREALKHYGFL